MSKARAAIQFGTVFTESFSTLTGWTNIGAGSFTPDGSTGLTIGAGATDYLKWIEYDALPNTAESFLISFQVEVLAVGILAASVQTRRLVPGSHKKTFIGSFIGGATTGRVVIATYADGSSTTVSNVADDSPDNIAYAVGHILNYTFRRTAINEYTCTVFNVNNSQQTTIGYNQIPDASPVVVAANNSASVSVQCVSGSFRIVPGTFVFSSTLNRNIRALFIGDSRTTFMSASPATNRYANIVFAGSKHPFAVNAGAYDTTGQYVIQQAWINSYGAEYVFLAIGRNDIFYVIDTLTWQANYDSIRNGAAARGSKVVHILFPDDSSAAVEATFNAYVISTWGAVDQIIDLSGETYTYADGVHFTTTDHAAIGASIRAAMPWLYQ